MVGHEHSTAESGESLTRDPMNTLALSPECNYTCTGHLVCNDPPMTRQ